MDTEPHKSREEKGSVLGTGKVMSKGGTREGQGNKGGGLRVHLNIYPPVAFSVLWPCALNFTVLKDTQKGERMRMEEGGETAHGA